MPGPGKTLKNLGSFAWKQAKKYPSGELNRIRNFDIKNYGKMVWDPNAEGSGIPPEALRSILQPGALPIEQQIRKNLQTLTGSTGAEIEELIVNNPGLQEIISIGMEDINLGNRGWGPTSLSKGEVNEYLNQSITESGDIQERYPQIEIEDTYRTEFKKGGTYKRQEGGAIKNVKPTGRIPMGGMTSAFRFDWKNKK